MLKLKETCESTKKQLLEVQTKLHTVETGFSLLQEENNNITDKIVQISGEKDETEAMYKVKVMFTNQKSTFKIFFTNSKIFSCVHNLSCKMDVLLVSFKNVFSSAGG